VGKYFGEWVNDTEGTRQMLYRLLYTNHFNGLCDCHCKSQILVNLHFCNWRLRKNRRVKDFWIATVYQKHRALLTTKKDV